MANVRGEELSRSKRLLWNISNYRIYVSTKQVKVFKYVSITLVQIGRTTLDAFWCENSTICQRNISPFGVRAAGVYAYFCDCPDRLLLIKLLLHPNDVGFLKKTCYMPTFGCLVKQNQRLKMSYVYHSFWFNLRSECRSLSGAWNGRVLICAGKCPCIARKWQSLETRQYSPDHSLHFLLRPNTWCLLTTCFGYESFISVSNVNKILFSEFDDKFAQNRPD